MQAFQQAAAVFCMACIGAELVSLFAGQSRAGRCIKAVAGLYILAVLLTQLPRLPVKVKAVFRAVRPGGHVCCTIGRTGNGDPDRGQGQAGRILHRTVPPTVRAEHLHVGHAGNAGQQVVVKKAVVAFPAGCTAAQRQAVPSFLQQALGTVPTIAEEVHHEEG